MKKSSLFRAGRLLSILVFIVSILTLSGGAHGGNLTARELNTKGYRLYKQKKYAEAIEYFEESIRVNPDYALPYYNLACTLGILRTQGKVCYYNAYQSTIMEHLERSIELDPGRRKRALEDPDLESVHGTFRYQKILGRDISKPGDVKKMLVAITWYGPSPGAYGPVAGLTFLEEGRIEMWATDAASGDMTKKLYHTGFYSVEKDSSIIIQLGRAIMDGNGTFLGRLNPDGVLKIPAMGIDFTDDPDECSA